MAHFDAIESFNVLQKLIETVISTVVGFGSESFIANEDLIVRVNIRNAVGQGVLGLRSQVPDDVREDPRSEFIALISFPVMRFNELYHDFSYLEEVVLRVRGYDDQESQYLHHNIGRILQVLVLLREVLVQHDQSLS